MTVMSRLRDLDRRAGVYAQPTEEQWQRAAARWRWLLLVAAAQVLTAVVTAAFHGPAGAVASLTGFVAVGLAFQAGRLKAEHDRLRGRDDVIGGLRRPSGL